MIDNPPKRFILKIGNNRKNADKEKQGTRRLTFSLDNSLIKGRIANLVFSTQGSTTGQNYMEKDYLKKFIDLGGSEFLAYDQFAVPEG
ncbi:MAG: hypothetical protein KJ822_18410, partial [Proteobacteria bacterium]|nr:hypothetical protein [Pseudomonadota bacterium]